MTEKPSAWPLAWPSGWPRTPHPSKGLYQTALPAALNNLRKEIRLLAGTMSADSLVLSSNCTLGESNPKDAGVVAYFVFDKQQIGIPCDRWSSVAHNVQAIALTIDAMRAMERHGAKHMIKAMFQGFVALPSPDGKQPWWKVLGFEQPATDLGVVEMFYKREIRKAHPDAGGTHERAAELNAAIAEARRVLA